MNVQTPGLPLRRQRGAALITGLLILVLVILLGITALSSTVLQERMTGSQRNQSLAFAGAESAVRQGEHDVWLQYSLRSGANRLEWYDPEPIDNTNVVRSFRGTRNSFPAQATVYPSSITDYVAITPHPGSSKLSRAPVFIIEALGGSGQTPESHSDAAPQLYRITARSTGGDGRVIRTTESVYVTSLPPK